MEYQQIALRNFQHRSATANLFIGKWYIFATQQQFRVSPIAQIRGKTVPDMERILPLVGGAFQTHIKSIFFERTQYHVALLRNSEKHHIKIRTAAAITGDSGTFGMLIFETKTQIQLFFQHSKSGIADPGKKLSFVVNFDRFRINFKVNSIFTATESSADTGHPGVSRSVVSIETINARSYHIFSTEKCYTGIKYIISGIGNIFCCKDGISLVTADCRA